jgi:cytochrome c peroxidase
MNRGKRGLWMLALLGLCSAGCGENKKANAVDLGEAAEPAPVSAPATSAAPSAETATVEFNPRLLRRFQPVRAVLAPEGAAPTPAQVELGRALYFEKRLSKTGELSCNSCHPLARYGADGEPTSPGHDGTRGKRNSPTVYHAAGLFAQFWDGRAADVEAQAKGPILNPGEMGMKDAKQVEKVLAGIRGYKERFAAAFPGEANPLTYDNVGKAIGAFERGLVTPSRWDAYLKGDKNALSAAEVEGLRVFTNVGCMVCHTGEFVGGSIYAKAGVVEPWDNQKDQGRYEVTKAESDRMMFKVPTLRNIAKTAPYFHDGSAATLDAAVRKMGKHQLGLELSEPEVTSIVTWLESLTGPLPSDYIAEPKPVDAAG